MRTYMYTRICENPDCNKEIHISKREILRGKGIYCSTKCINRKVPSYLHVCQVCKLPFKTTIKTNYFCSLECQESLNTSASRSCGGNKSCQSESPSS